MHIRLRYVTSRANKKGGERHYWQRPSHPLTRLPADLSARIAEAERLNSRADAIAAREPAEPTRGSLGWVIAKYRQSDQYRELAPGTAKYYNRYIRDIEALGPRLSFTSFTRQAVVDFIESYPARHQRRQAAAVLKALFGRARYYGIVDIDLAAGLRLKTTRPRERLWSDTEIAAWLGAAATEDPHMTTAFLLLLYTAQRPTDMLRMTWPQYARGAIRLTQQKTRALLEVPLHPELAHHLDTLPRARNCLSIIAYRGRPVAYGRFNERFARITAATGIDGAQARDLRRTAMVNMALAGATAPQIASVSGHSIEATTRILETYLPRNRALAEAAITKLADHQAKQRNA
jgi:hypothetical protein